MKRAEVEADQMPGQDSFLDVITNIVGILILLVLVVGLRTSHSVSDTGALQSAERARSESELQQAINTAMVTRGNVHELVDRVGKARFETAYREDERTWLSNKLAAAEQEIADRRSKLTGDGQRDFDLRQKIAVAQATLDDLARQQMALMARDANVEEIECQPTPVAKTVVGKQVHILLSDDHVAVVPFDELMERMKADAQTNVWRLQQQGELEGTVGPIGNFRLRYWFIKEDVSGRSNGGTLMTGSVGRFSHAYILPVSAPIGETAEEAMGPNSELFQQLQRHKPEGTTVTIWTYPGNYERLRELKRTIRQVGFQIAVRPLPAGMPIGASSNGSDSLSE
jgi:hypothetical protein